MILDKKQNFSLKPLSVACLLMLVSQAVHRVQALSQARFKSLMCWGQKMSAKKINRRQVKASAVE